MTAVRRARRRRLRTTRPRRRPALRRRLPQWWPPVGRRVMLAVLLLAVLVFPVAGLADGGQPQQAACRGCGGAVPPVVQRWAVALPGAWSTGSGGTVPTAGQAYVAVGDGIAAVGNGLTLTGYALADGRELWQTTLTGPAGASIMSVRAWPGAVTAGVLSVAGDRTETVVSSATGAQLRSYPAAVFGGAVAASLATTVVVGRKGVTSYDNKNGHVRWYHPTGLNQPWRVDGTTLYVARSAGGYLGSAPVTALQVIDLTTGIERPVSSPLGQPFAGTLALAAGGVALFASADGVTAYSGSTGVTLWSRAGSVPEGADPDRGLVYLTSGGSEAALVGVDPLTGQVKTSVLGTGTGSTAQLYVVHGGVGLGLDAGAGGDAWAYDVAAGRVTWTSPTLPWPHYFADLSGLGGSASASAGGNVAVVSACPQGTSTAGLCPDPELVAFTL